MTLLVASQIVMWILLIALALLNFALIRQIGVLYERVAPAGALAVNRNLKVGEQAPEMSFTDLNEQEVSIGGADAEGRSSLLFFLSPDCPVCKTLLPALKSAAKAESDWLRVILASDGSEQDHRGFVQEYDLGHFTYIVSELLGKTYGVARLPYAVVIDQQGLIAALGIVNSREHLDSLFEAKDRGIASIQDYFDSNAGYAALEQVK